MTHELSSTTLALLNILNDGQRHAGTEIAKVLGVSRMAIWKVVQRLKAYNIEIKSEHLGYRLESPLFLLEKSKIQKYIFKDVTLDIFESLPSTNDYLKNLPSAPPPHICLAEHQTNGRGRLGRSWTSPFGRNIYCSISYVFKKDISEMAGLSLVVGILTAKALEIVDQQFKPSLKWPNDIYLEGKKAGGILIDLIAEANGTCKAILGIGLNVNMKDILMRDVKNWICLEEMIGQKLDRNQVTGEIINSLFKGMEIFANRGLAPFLSDWKRLDFLENKKITLTSGQEIHSGIAKGISPQGHLFLELPQGLKQFSYGDTSLFKD
ncbi:MAG: biotin--[acetyl-CoA-carboxylase] ligase [Alphaproteobacteria bacterium]|nr:biotin--[acetyl-CoA-carboxylase] ligase [Alphaproteobacteria bacterium]